MGTASRRVYALLSGLFVLPLTGCPDASPTYFDYDGDTSPDAVDCGPADPTIYPGAPDPFDSESGVDENCDGIDGIDSDGDGYPGNSPIEHPRWDCNDSNAEIYPDAEDPFDDEGSVDENCDGVDGIDQDGDGYAGDRAPGDPLLDCDDSNAAVHPGVPEDPNTPLDENCDGIGADFDGDGFETPEDCNDDPAAGGASVYPGAAEICNEIDDDCDTLVDEDADGQPLFDSDGDGWNSCSECDDDLDSVHPEATEVCDGVDNDCDGQVDEDTTEGTPGSCLCPYNFGGNSCREVRDQGHSQGSGIYIVQPDLAPAPYKVYCDMDMGGGGWTLALISSDDGQDTWTTNNSAWMGASPVPVGDVCGLQPDFATAADYKSLAYNQLLFADLMFIHHSIGGGQAFETWAQYDGVSNNSQSIGSFTAAQPYPDCEPQGYPMTDGNLLVAGSLCYTDLFFNVADTNVSDGEPCPGDYSSFGPTWNIRIANNTCSPDVFHSPGSNASLGPCAVDWGTHVEWVSLGFGTGLNINVGIEGSGENHIRMYVR